VRKETRVLRRVIIRVGVGIRRRVREIAAVVRIETTLL